MNRPTSDRPPAPAGTARRGSARRATARHTVTLRLGVLAAAAALALAACGSSGSSPASSTASGGKATLTFWSWVPGIAKQVALFNQSHPSIHVNLVQTPTGAAGTYAKMFTAIKAGDTPDLGQIEFDVLPSFARTGGLLNLAKYGANSDAGDFTPTAWKQVDFGGGTWAIPQATGPTGLFYNATLFNKYGLSVPTTWAQFASEARSLHAAHPGVYLTNFDTDPSWLAMFTWQAGGRWFQIQGNSWKLGFTDSGSMQVANYWQNLIASKAIPVEPSFNAAWYKQLGNGTLLTWPTAQWGTTIMQDDAPGGSGQWRIAPMPQWSAGASTYGQYGGSTTAVFKTTKHPQAALTFALWMNTNAQAIQAGVVAGFGWPAATSGTSVPALHGTVSYFGPKRFYPIFQTSQNDTAPGWSYGPDYATVLTQMGDLFSGLSSGSATLPGILNSAGQEQASSLKSAGISVTG
jgi:multiple sugar transport system substrate-binding protein